MEQVTALLKSFTEHAQSQPVAFALALVISFLITPVIARRSALLGNNRVEEGRDHTTPPRLGGIAIFIAILVTIVFYLAFYGRYTPHGFTHLELEGMATAGVIVFFVGLMDDIKPLNPFVKLLGQSTAAILAWLMEVRIDFLANPLYYFDSNQIATIKLDELTSLVVTVIFLVAITNAVNLIDGIDGLATGTCLIAAIATWAITMSPLLNQPAGAILAATLAGACLGFLRYNFNPARIFLGDGGAYLLGFTLASMSCIGLVKKVTVVILIPVIFMIFLVPLFDTAWAILRRASKNESVVKPDTDHLHHMLLKSGFSQKQVNYALYTITYIGGLAGTWALGADIMRDYLVISLAVFGIWVFYSLVINRKKQKF